MFILTIGKACSVTKIPGILITFWQEHATTAWFDKSVIKNVSSFTDCNIKKEQGKELMEWQRNFGARAFRKELLTWLILNPLWHLINSTLFVIKIEILQRQMKQLSAYLLNHQHSHAVRIYKTNSFSSARRHLQPNFWFQISEKKETDVEKDVGCYSSQHRGATP